MMGQDRVSNTGIAKSSGMGVTRKLSAVPMCKSQVLTKFLLMIQICCLVAGCFRVKVDAI